VPVLPTFPNPVDETVARITAGEVVVINVVALASGQLWLLPVVGADFVARTLAGPRFSPLAKAAKALAPRLGLAERPTAGPPKRFAAAIGATLMVGASVLAFVGALPAAYAVMGVMVLFPALESFAGVCVGCWMFGLLMKANLVPASVCAECADVRARIGAPHPDELKLASD
jgi:hypothetical protein